MLKKLAQFVLTLILLLQVSPAFASSEISAKKFMACEKAFLNHEKTSIAIDKEEKQESPNLQKITTLNYNIVRIEKMTDRYCTEFPTQASNF